MMSSAHTLSDRADAYRNDLQYSGNGFPCMAESQVAFTKETMSSIRFWFGFSFESTLIVSGDIKRIYLMHGSVIEIILKVVMYQHL